MLANVVLTLLQEIKNNIVVDTGDEIRGISAITMTEDGKSYIFVLEDNQESEQKDREYIESLKPTEQPDEQSPNAPKAGAIKDFELPEKKDDTGIVSESTKPEIKDGTGLVSEPEKSQNKDGSGVSEEKIP